VGIALLTVEKQEINFRTIHLNSMFSKRSQIFLLNINLRDAKSSEIMPIGLDFFSVYVNLVDMKKWKRCYN